MKIMSISFTAEPGRKSQEKSNNQSRGKKAEKKIIIQENNTWRHVGSTRVGVYERCGGEHDVGLPLSDKKWIKKSSVIWGRYWTSLAAWFFKNIHEIPS